MGIGSWFLAGIVVAALFGIITLIRRRKSKSQASIPDFTAAPGPETGSCPASLTRANDRFEFAKAGAPPPFSFGREASVSDRAGFDECPVTEVIRIAFVGAALAAARGRGKPRPTNRAHDQDVGDGTYGQSPRRRALTCETTSGSLPFFDVCSPSDVSP